MSAQMKAVEESNPSTMVNTLDRDKGKTKHCKGSPDPQQRRECWNCGRRHDLQRRELCPAYGKRCSKCHKMNHFAAKCCSGGSLSVHPVTSTEGVHIEESKEIFQAYTTNTSLDDSQLVTLWLESGNHIRFQVDTRAQCNVVPLGVYKKAAKDPTLAWVSPSCVKITAYGGPTLSVVGTVHLRV